ncbi:MAG TPA: preprotein translocase subunit YajC [Halanaerobiales bacterium]|nr:preprotein translocase subunit YajC [Halanaerobiales bacterium]
MQYVYAILPWVLIFGVFWFFLIRPQRKQQKEHEEMLNNLEVGDKIVTIGGIKGKIIKLKDNNIRLRISSDVDIDVVQKSIARLDTSEEEAEEPINDEKMLD